MMTSTPSQFIERLRIRETAERYFFYSDAHDAAGVARCFALNGVFRSLTQIDMNLHGRAEIETGFQGFSAWGRSCHVIASMIVDVTGEEATAKLFGMSYVAGAAKEGDPIRVRGLSYADKWIVESGEWVIVERVHEALWQFEETLIHTQLPPRNQSPTSQILQGR
jgi:hypothetical protein